MLTWEVFDSMILMTSGSLIAAWLQKRELDAARAANFVKLLGLFRTFVRDSGQGWGATLRMAEALGLTLELATWAESMVQEVGESEGLDAGFGKIELISEHGKPVGFLVWETEPRHDEDWNILEGWALLERPKVYRWEYIFWWLLSSEEEGGFEPIWVSTIPTSFIDEGPEIAQAKRLSTKLDPDKVILTRDGVRI